MKHEAAELLSQYLKINTSNPPDLLDNYPDEFQADLVINEGGFGLTDVLANRPLFMIATAEKGRFFDYKKCSS